MLLLVTFLSLFIASDALYSAFTTFSPMLSFRSLPLPSPRSLCYTSPHPKIDSNLLNPSLYLLPPHLFSLILAPVAPSAFFFYFPTPAVFSSCYFHLLLLRLPATSSSCYFLLLPFPPPATSFPAVSSSCYFLLLLLPPIAVSSSWYFLLLFSPPVYFSSSSPLLICPLSSCRRRIWSNSG